MRPASHREMTTYVAKCLHSLVLTQHASGSDHVGSHPWLIELDKLRSKILSSHHSHEIIKTNIHSFITIHIDGKMQHLTTVEGVILPI